VKYSKELFKVRKFRETFDIASLALSKMTLPSQLQNELLTDEQVQLLDMIDVLLENGDFSMQNIENQTNYQTVEDNLRKLCSIKKVKGEYCYRFKTKNLAN